MCVYCTILLFDMLVSRIILIYCVILHFQIVNGSFVFHMLSDEITHSINILQGVSCLLYPFCGLVAESYLKKFNFTKWSCLLVLISSIVQLIIGILEFKGIRANELSITLGVLSICTSTFGLGMFEANAIRFGMNQMLDASSEQLSSFIHWYFWCSNAGVMLTFYVPLVFYLSTNKCIQAGIFRHLEWTLGISVCLYFMYLRLLLQAFISLDLCWLISFKSKKLSEI